MRLFFVLTLAACSGKDGGDSSGGADTGPQDNPLVPEAYRGLWDTEASYCEDANAILYFAFSGGVDSSGKISGSEGFYWFFNTEGFEGDCVDTFTVSGERGEVNWSSDPCTGCDMEYLADWELEDSNRTCADAYDYEFFFLDSNDDEVETDSYSLSVMLDPLSPSGMVNQFTYVYSFVEETSGSSYLQRPNATGDVTPEVEGDYEGALSIEWVVQQGVCIEISG